MYSKETLITIMTRTSEYLLELFSSNLSTRLICLVLNNVEVQVLNEPFDYVDDTYLILVTKRNQIPLVQYLVARPGIEIDKRNASTYHDTALSWAVYLGHHTIARILIEARPEGNGADINMKTKLSGKNLLYWAYSQSHYGLFKYLLIQGCIVTATDDYDQSILDRIPKGGVYYLLVERYQNALKKILHTYLHHKVTHYERHVVKIILQYYPGLG